jgi:TolB-like protein/Flp pilus assembly protein TadD
MSTQPAGRIVAFFRELRRRKVYRATAIYLVLAVGGLEVASVLLPSTTLPAWFDELFLGLAIVGLPLVIVLAWTFDVTDVGIERTPDRVRAGNEPRAAEDLVGSTSEEPAPGARRRSSVETLRQPGSSGEEEEAADRPELDPLAVAVLPFENLSRSDDAEPFAVGLHDDLLTELSRASALTVISRTSVKGYREGDKPIRQIARELGAGTIVEGGVQQSGSRVRLNVQLIDARTDAHLWAERYDRELTTENIFELQSELASKIMAELHAQLTAAEKARSRTQPTADLETYRLLVAGRQALIDRSEEGFRAAGSFFQRAIERDAENALAWALLGSALVGLVDYRHLDSDDVLREAEEACRRALELDPNLAESHSAWGALRSCLRDAPGAITAHGRAIELRPSYAGAYQWSCWSHLLLGNAHEALYFGKRAVRLDPLDPEAAGNLAIARLGTGDAEGALELARRIIARHPGFEYGLCMAGLALQALDRWDEAADALGRLEDRWALGWPEMGRAAARHAAGDEAAVRQELSKLSGRHTAFERGVIHAMLGELDEAFDEMREEWPLPWPESLYLYFSRAAPMDRVRQDPRFDPLMMELRRSWQSAEG